MNIYNIKCSSVITKQLKDKKQTVAMMTLLFIWINEMDSSVSSRLLWYSWSVDLLRKELGQMYNSYFDYLSLSTFHLPSSVMANQLIYFYTISI